MKWRSTFQRRSPNKGNCDVVFSLKKADGSRSEFSGTLREKEALAFFHDICATKIWPDDAKKLKRSNDRLKGAALAVPD